MNSNLVQSLILYLVDQLQDMGAPVSKIRLVKLLYLIDVEHFRAYGRTLTGIDWIFHHYGPWSAQIDSAMRGLGFQLEVEAIVTPMDYQARTYRVQEPQSLYGEVKFSVEAKINKLIKRWAFEELHDLLDFVYMDTEPMQNASFGERLDFSTIRRRTSTASKPGDITFSPEKEARLRACLQDIASEVDAVETLPAQYDDTYYEAVAIMDREDTIEAAIDGPVTFTPEAMQNLRSKSE